MGGRKRLKKPIFKHSGRDYRVCIFSTMRQKGCITKYIPKCARVRRGRGSTYTTRANKIMGLKFVWHAVFTQREKLLSVPYRFSRQRHRPSVTGTENYDDIISKKLLTGGKRKARNEKPWRGSRAFHCCIVTMLHCYSVTSGADYKTLFKCPVRYAYRLSF